MESFEADLKSLVEETYANNAGTPVTTVSHSMGCYHALYFLQQQSQVRIRTFLCRSENCNEMNKA